MTEPDYKSVDAKLRWAKRHFEEADVEIAAWLNDDAHLIIYERNEDRTQHYLRAQFASTPDLERWALMIGDCVSNLRDTLDHLIYAVARAGSSPRPDKIETAAFVIAECPKTFSKAKGRLLSVSNCVKDAVVSLQPYNRPHTILPPLLSILSELANGSKHKLLSVVFASPEIMQLQFISANTANPKAAQFALRQENIGSGDTFAVLELPSPDPYCHLKVGRVKFTIAVGHKSLPNDVSFDAAHTSYKPLLEYLIGEVEHCISTVKRAVSDFEQ